MPRVHLVVAIAVLALGPLLGCGREKPAPDGGDARGDRGDDGPPPDHAGDAAARDGGDTDVGRADDDAQPAPGDASSVDVADADAAGGDAPGDADAGQAVADGPADVHPTGDAGDDRFRIAPHPAAPQIVYRGGRILASPRLIAVTDDDYDQRAQVDDMLAKLGTSSYWKEVTASYGVGAATGAAIHRPGKAPAAVDDLQIQAWLGAQFDGAHPEVGTPADDQVFVFYFPTTTKVTIATLVGCVSYGGYHSFTSLPSGPWAGQKVAYAVIPTCTGGAGPLANTTAATSHEVAETVTDPFGDLVRGGLGWQGVDDDHKVWEIFRGGEGEVGDLCEGIHLGNFIPHPFPYLTQRIWSNSAAAAGHDPCVPWAFGGKPYFNSAPVLDDVVTLRRGGQTYRTKGVLIPLGQQRTIEIVLFSDQPNAPWTVTPSDLSSFLGGGPHLAFSWEGGVDSGQNGTKLRLTITALAPTIYGGEPFMLTSSDGNFRQEWFGYVAQE